jgi:hypothetical protein
MQGKMQNKLVNDNSLKSDITWYLCDIQLTTRELETYFGCKPRTSTQDHSRYEWVFEYNGYVYNIYDWSYMDSTFDEYYQTEWYLGGKQFRDIQMIYKLLEKKTMINPIEVESVLEW